MHLVLFGLSSPPATVYVVLCICLLILKSWISRSRLSSVKKNPLFCLPRPEFKKMSYCSIKLWNLPTDIPQFSSVAQSCPTLSDPMNCSTQGLPVHHQLLEFTQTHVHRVGDAIQPSHPVFPFSSCPQSLPASESFPMSQLFAWSGQSIGVSALASVLPMNTQDWSHLGWSGWILQSKGLSRVFSNTTVQKHQFFSAQPSSQSNSNIHAWPLDKP